MINGYMHMNEILNRERQKACFKLCQELETSIKKQEDEIKNIKTTQKVKQSSCFKEKQEKALFSSLQVYSESETETSCPIREVLLSGVCNMKYLESQNKLYIASTTNKLLIKPHQRQRETTADSLLVLEINLFNKPTYRTADAQTE